MSSKLIKIAVILAALSAPMGAIENPAGSPRRSRSGPLQSQNPAVENPAGSSTVPPSSFRSGLVRSPNPIDTSGNLVITGNVSGGRFFRGIVPYHATTDFEGSVGSSSLDTFIRDSAGAENYDSRESYGGKPASYYSPTQSVTTMIPGSRGGILGPLPTRIEGRAESGLPPSAAPKGQPLTEYNTSLFYNKYRPLSTPVSQLEKMFAEEAEKYPEGQNVGTAEKISEQRQKQIEQFRYDLRQASEKVAELKQNLTIPTAPLQPSGEKKVAEGVLPPQTQTIEGKQPDVYAQMQKEVDTLQKKFETIQKLTAAAQTGRKTVAEANKPAKEASVAAGPNEPSAVDISFKAEGLLGEHKTFASFSEDKFNQYMRTAEKYLKEGKYYRAADLYTLASVHKPADPLPYAGKSLALFAAGEYMSSSLFLSRAIELFPGYAQFKVDLVSIVGDKDMLESRIAEVERWLQKNDAPELQFLLGYVYYQMNRLTPAKKNIDAAYDMMPGSSAAAVLKKAIDEAAGQ